MTDKARRVTMPISSEGYAMLDTLKKAWGLPKQEILSLVMANVTPEMEPFKTKALELATKKGSFKKRLSTITANIRTPEQVAALEKALKDAGIDVG